ncbi:AAA family ATPase [Escherichia coli]|nr:AAA family ATPase [Escherichia coli]ELM7733411.1 AAA family ATPase [Escherichia coli]ELM7796514.1 AAA family ATPase [Escherichia coli]ELM7806244.1 AAA family ATPase [Escherichia coli]ELM7810737.1 AAA family ATPase [Escherichia coli]
MLIKNVEIKGFKSFDCNGQNIRLDSFTSLIGGNGTGKTALLLALVRMFSVKSADRVIQADDFHVPPGEKIDDQDERNFTIRIRFEFADLKDGQDSTVSDFFGHLVSDGKDEIPYCIAKLRAKWIKTNLAGGDIESELVWEVGDEERKISAYERSRIHVHYVPAYRDPSTQLKQTAGTIMHRLINAVEWSDDIAHKIGEGARSIDEQFQNESGIKTITTSLAKNWNSLFTGGYFENLKIHPVMNGVEDVLKHIDTVFLPTPDTQPLSTDRLSDGMKSLFYLSLVKSAFDIESDIIEGLNENLAISIDALEPPDLTLILIEEPENHLSPQYFGRIINLCRAISSNKRAQVFLSTHSPALLNRVEPENIRYFRLCENQKTIVKNIILPEEDDNGEEIDEFTYVKEAIKSHPEIYFAKVVVLGEGDSEEIVIPKLAEANSIGLDNSLITFAPLGGRYVNHFWRLLSELSIPYITLLDYDRKRGGGGYGRIKYALKQLISTGVDKSDILKLQDGKVLSDKELDEMHTWVEDETTENSWINVLKRYGVFFSYPYDLDWIMLEKFYEEYKSFAPSRGGPTIPSSHDDNYTQKTQAAIASVLKKESIDIDISEFTDHEKYFWYRYLFLGRGKPLSHNYVLKKMSRDDLKERAPQVLNDLIEKIKGIL